MKIINYGHACFQIIGDNVTLLFDPYQNDSVPNLKLPKIDTDYVLISHDHHDHNAIELINNKNIKKFNCIEVVVPHDKQGGKLRGLNKIHIVEIDGIRLAHFGDIGCITSEIEMLENIDIAFIPINGYYTIGPIEAIQLANKIKAKCLIPMHYYNKEDKTGYEDGNQIEIFVSKLSNINYVDGDELEITNQTKGVYIFKKARGRND